MISTGCALLTAVLLFAPICQSPAVSEPNRSSDTPSSEEPQMNDPGSSDETSDDNGPEAQPDPKKKPHPALFDPSKTDETAPDTFRVRMNTTKGSFVIEAHREWAPHGVDRFYNLVNIGYFDDVAFFRVIEGFMAQFGIHGNPKVNKAWRNATIPDDPVEKSNRRGYVTFAQTSAPNSRSTQLFINYADNSRLDRQGFAPIGKVVEGMDVVDDLYAGYGEGAPRGNGPNQKKIRNRGNQYLNEQFLKLDYIEQAELIDE